MVQKSFSVVASLLSAQCRSEMRDVFSCDARLRAEVT